jgi:hypothetical protein
MMLALFEENGTLTRKWVTKLNLRDVYKKHVSYSFLAPHGGLSFQVSNSEYKGPTQNSSIGVSKNAEFYAVLKTIEK